MVIRQPSSWKVITTLRKLVFCTYYHIHIQCTSAHLRVVKSGTKQFLTSGLGQTNSAQSFMSPWTVGRAHSNLSRRLTWTVVYQIVSRSFHCLVWKEWMRQNLYKKGPFLCKIDQFWSLCISKLNTTSIHSEGLWVQECLVRPCFHLKVLLQWLNSKGFSKVCFFMCCCKLLEVVQTWLHWSHVNGHESQNIC